MIAQQLQVMFQIPKTKGEQAEVTSSSQILYSFTVSAHGYLTSCGCWE